MTPHGLGSDDSTHAALECTEAVISVLCEEILTESVMTLSTTAQLDTVIETVVYSTGDHKGSSSSGRTGQTG